MGALTGNMAVQYVKAGFKAIYLSGWQVAADANLAGQMYPDQSLYPANSVPNVVRTINNHLRRADEISHMEGDHSTHWFAPIMADAEAGFGGNLNSFELMKAMIEAGAAGVHYEDQLASEKKCGHLGGKVLIPGNKFVRTLTAARLAADVLNVPTVLVARTDAESGKLITADYDEFDERFINGAKTSDGFYPVKNGIDACIERGRLYAPFADLIWMETSKPDVNQARDFAQGMHEKFPGKLLAYNCSPSFDWKKNFRERVAKEHPSYNTQDVIVEADHRIRNFQQQLSEMGYKFQFVTLAGFHLLNYGAYTLAQDYLAQGMLGYANFQEKEFGAEAQGYGAVKHQKTVGTGYFDEIQKVISNGQASTIALKEATEQDFRRDTPAIHTEARV